eukprot:2244406-Pleurochrysis_carterae.AAC.5
MGVAFRKLEPDRPRRTTDGDAPARAAGLSTKTGNVYSPSTSPPSTRPRSFGATRSQLSMPDGRRVSVRRQHRHRHTDQSFHQRLSPTHSTPHNRSASRYSTRPLGRPRSRRASLRSPSPPAHHAC